MLDTVEGGESLQQAAASHGSGSEEEIGAQDSGSDEGTLRERVFHYLRTTIGETGARAIINFKQAAVQFNVTPVTFAHHVKALEKEGRVRRKSAGRRGTIVWLLSARPPRKEKSAANRRARLAPAKATARGSRRAVSAAAPAAGGTRLPARAAATAGARSGSFCPWCGNKTARGWRFCGACGHSLASE